MQTLETTHSIQPPPAPGGYLLPRNSQERRRLQIQGEITNPFTEALFVRAGIRPGMRILDLGCGVGEVSRIAARLAGPTGSVVGVDVDPAALDVARTRAFDEGLDNVTFSHRDICYDSIDGTFDAVVGRHILIHLQEPQRMLRRVAELLRPRGLAVFHEYDMSVTPPSSPELQLFNRMIGMGRQVVARVLRHPDLGAQMYRMMGEVGLEHPKSHAEFLIDGGPDNLICDWLAETMRAILPYLESAGVITAAELDVDSLAERLRTECQHSNRQFMSIALLVGTYARKAY
jgi:ubiquinone/menaquinone biosynthesis C-methylase UbiE